MKNIVGLLPLGFLLFLVACGDKTASTTTAPAAGNVASAATQNAAPASNPVANHPGKGVHDANCISCHDVGVYTRADRKVKDLDQLTAQVQRCDANLGAKLSAEEIGKVIDYLNQAFYKFPKKA